MVLPWSMQAHIPKNPDTCVCTHTRLFYDEGSKTICDNMQNNKAWLLSNITHRSDLNGWKAWPSDCKWEKTEGLVRENRGEGEGEACLASSRPQFNPWSCLWFPQHWWVGNLSSACAAPRKNNYLQKQTRALHCETWTSEMESDFPLEWLGKPKNTQMTKA